MCQIICWTIFCSSKIRDVYQIAQIKKWMKIGKIKIIFFIDVKNLLNRIEEMKKKMVKKSNVYVNWSMLICKNQNSLLLDSLNKWI